MFFLTLLLNIIYHAVDMQYLAAQIGMSDENNCYFQKKSVLLTHRWYCYIYLTPFILALFASSIYCSLSLNPSLCKVTSFSCLENNSLHVFLQIAPPDWSKHKTYTLFEY